MIPSLDITPWLEVKNYTEDSISEKKQYLQLFVLLERLKKSSRV